MASRIDIINMALANIGHQPIASTAENQKDAYLIGVHYDTALRDILRSHPWGFATRRVTMAELPWSPGGFAHAYAYPPDCVMARHVTRDGCEAWGLGGAKFEVGRSLDGRQKVILCNVPPPARLEYTSAMIEPPEFDPQFTFAFSWRLSAALTMGVHNDPQAHQAALQTYYATLELAKSDDGRETKLPRIPDGEFMNARKY